MSKYDPKYIRHMEICESLNKMYVFKNDRYNDSFGKQFEELGPVSAIVRLADKFNRLKTLLLDGNLDGGDESVMDTLDDMTNYCIMTRIELEEIESRKPCSPPELEHNTGPAGVSGQPMHVEPKRYTTKHCIQDPTSTVQCTYCANDKRKPTDPKNKHAEICDRCYDFSKFVQVKE